MAITKKDIVLYQAQDNTDNDSGGGARSANLVIDAKVNNLFPDISRLNSVSGDVEMRKVFPVVKTQNADVYHSAHAILRNSPKDPLVSSVIVHTDNDYDRRSDAQAFIESYLKPSYKSAAYLFGVHVVGSRVITLLQNTNEPIASIGDTYYLKDNASGNEQYVRVKSVNNNLVDLTHSSLTYKMRRLICEIDQPLNFAYVGSEFTPDGQQADTSDVYHTEVSQSLYFYGNKTLTNAAALNDTTLNVGSIDESLVPTSKTYTPLLGVAPIIYTKSIATANSGVEFTKNLAFYKDTTYNLNAAIRPGSVRVPTWQLTDDGQGNLVNASGQIWGTIDYINGKLLITYNVNGTAAIYFKYAHVVNSATSYSALRKIDNSNRSIVQIFDVTPVPSTQSVAVDYVHKGIAYRIAGNSDGTIGNSDVGTGSVSDNGNGTATISITMKNIPDLDSQVIVSWATNSTVVDVTSEVSTPIRRVHIPLGVSNIKPSSVSLAVGAANSHVITVGTDGRIVSTRPSDVSGWFDEDNGEIVLDWANGNMIPANTSHKITGTVEVFNSAPVLQKVTAPNFVLSANQNESGWIIYEYDSAVAITSGTCELIVNAIVGESLTNGLPWESVTSIVMRGYRDGTLLPMNMSNYVIKGSFTSAGLFKLHIRQGSLVSVNESYAPISAGATVGYLAQAEAAFTVKQNGYIKFLSVTEINIKTAQKSDSDPSTSIPIELTPYLENTATVVFSGIPGFIDGAMMQESTNIASTNYLKNGQVKGMNSNVQVGIYNSQSGIITIDYKNAQGRLNEITITNMAINRSSNSSYVDALCAKLAAVDLKVDSVAIRYRNENGVHTATVANDGKINGNGIDVNNSFVDPRNGSVFVQFTSRVSPDSIQYDLSAATFIPLPSDLIGINPTRLPSNGKVPIFKQGNFLVIFHEAETNVAPVAGETVTLARDKLAYIEVVDANGKRLDTDMYTEDRAAGTVTFANPLTLVDVYGEALTAPYRIIDRVEDMTLCAEAHSNGAIELASPLTRDYPVGSKVASALAWGNIGARCHNVFSQASFDVWSDEQTTGSIVAKYNEISHPVIVTNEDTVSGRWYIKFTQSSVVEVVHERLGVVATGIDISTSNVAPVNNITGNPYFSFNKDGFGGGWVTGNIIRFNINSGDANMWIIRSVSIGQLTEDKDSIEVEIRGDAN